MQTKKIFLILTAAFILSASLTGCITRNYTDSSGQQCQKHYKFFLLFLKTSYTCQPASEAPKP